MTGCYNSGLLGHQTGFLQISVFPCLNILCNAPQKHQGAKASKTVLGSEAKSQCNRQERFTHGSSEEVCVHAKFIAISSSL